MANKLSEAENAKQDAREIRMLARVIREEASRERHNLGFESYVEAKAVDCLITTFKMGQRAGLLASRLALQEAGQSQALVREGRENG